MRISDLCRPLALGLSIAVALTPGGASATTIAYAADFFPGGVDYVRTNFVDPPQTIGDIMLTLVGAFAADDYEHQYWIDEALGRLHRSNTFTATSMLIGNVDLQGNLARGMHWDPVGQQMLLTEMDESCVATTLYRLDLANASTVEIGSTPGCIGGLAIDAQGHAFGVNESDATLVSIDTATGEATPVGPLNLDMQTPDGLDFDPESGLLYVFGYDATTSVRGMFLVDTASGNATLAHPYISNLLAISLAPAPETIFADGFDAMACPAGRIETSDVAYSDGTLTGLDITFFEGLWGRSSIGLDPAPFPGRPRLSASSISRCRATSRPQPSSIRLRRRRRRASTRTRTRRRPTIRTSISRSARTATIFRRSSASASRTTSRPTTAASSRGASPRMARRRACCTADATTSLTCA